jgi:hypothetical protein
MPTLAKHLKAATGSQANPQMIFVAPEPEFRDHIIEVKKPWLADQGIAWKVRPTTRICP